MEELIRYYYRFDGVENLIAFESEYTYTLANIAEDAARELYMSDERNSIIWPLDMQIFNYHMAPIGTTKVHIQEHDNSIEFIAIPNYEKSKTETAQG